MDNDPINVVQQLWHIHIVGAISPHVKVKRKVTLAASARASVYHRCASRSLRCAAKIKRPSEASRPLRLRLTAWSLVSGLLKVCHDGQFKAFFCSNFIRIKIRRLFANCIFAIVPLIARCALISSFCCSRLRDNWNEKQTWGVKLARYAKKV